VAAAYCPVAVPLHPRTLKCIRAAGIEPRTIDLLPPLSYLQILALESRARFIITDSGGMQKEAYFMHVPCITTRDETEWIETLENGCNVLTGSDEQSILGAAARAAQAGPWSNPYGDGRSCEVVLRTIQARYSPSMT
jgi:UDP-GlcNAc3NAcA epimerase